MAVPMFGDVLLNSEKMMSPVVPGFGSTEQSKVHAAWNGHEYFVVWADNRDTYPVRNGVSHFPGYAMRVDATGHPLSQSIAIPFSGFVFWSGDHYLVCDGEKSIRLRSDGSTIDFAPRALPVPPPGETVVNDSVNVVSNGREFLITYTTHSADFSTFAARGALFDVDLNAIGSYTFVTGPHDAPVTSASDGDGFLVASYHGSAYTPHLDPIVGTFIARDGRIVRNQPLVQYAVTPYDIYLGAGKSGYLLVSAFPRVAPPFISPALVYQMEFEGLFIDTTGTPVGDTGRFGSSDVYSPLFYDSPGVQVVWDGNEYLMAYTKEHVGVTSTPRPRGIRLQKVTSPVSVSAPIDFLEGDCTRCNLASNGSTMLLSWTAFGLTIKNVAVFGSPQSLADGPVPRFRLGASGSPQEEVSTAVSANGVALVAWREGADVTSELGVYASRVGEDGRILDTNPMKVGDASCDRAHPAIASDGHDFLVAWQADRDVLVRRVSANGHLPDAFPIVVAHDLLFSPCDYSKLSMVWDGVEYVLTWGAAINAPNDVNAHVYVVRIRPDGTPVELGPRDVTSSLSARITPVAASDRSGSTVIMWPEGSFLNVIRLNSSAVIDARFALNAAGTADAFYWDGHNYVAVLHDDAGVHLARMNRSLAPLADGAKPLTDVDIPVTASAALPICIGTDCTLTAVTADGLVRVARIVDSDTSISATVSTVASIALAEFRRTPSFSRALRASSINGVRVKRTT